MLRFPKRNSGKRAEENKSNNWERKKRKRTPNDSKQKPKKKKQKTRSYKQQIRDLERALNGKRPLPDHIREKKEQELKRLKHNRNSHAATTRVNHRTLRHNNQYGAPKFFDKRKLMRKLDQNTRALAKAEDPKAKENLEVKRKEIMDDLYYVAHFPKHIKYVSVIMARKKNDEKQLARIAQIKKHIRGSTEDSESDDEDPEFQEQVRQAALKKIEEEEKKEEKILKEIEEEKALVEEDAKNEVDPLLDFASESEEEADVKDAEEDAVAAFLAEENDSDDEQENVQEKTLSRKERRKQAIANARKKKAKPSV